MKERKTKRERFYRVSANDRENASYRLRRCNLAPSDDAELEKFFNELALTLLRIIDPDDAYVLTRSELQGQQLSQIAAEIGCNPAEASRRLNQARRLFCELIILTLIPTRSK